MELDIIPGNMEVALESEVEELRNQIQRQQELVLKCCRCLKQSSRKSLRKMRP